MNQTTEEEPSGAGRLCTVLVVCGLLVLAVAMVFGQTVRHPFVNYDDALYVSENPALAHGLTLKAVGWAFRTTYANFWHPLTWLSLLLDSQFYGFEPWGYHLTNVLLHAATTVLLFLILWRMTAHLWPSAFVAALFAIHPLHVESVAWVAQRKDVLSGLFFVLTIGAYLGYVRHPFSLVRYLIVVVVFAAGLMTKPVLVTLPLLLLLLDYWPLGRIVAGTLRVPSAVRSASDEQTAYGVCSLRWLILEKVPLLLVAIAFCVATPVAEGEAVMPLHSLSVLPRIGNGLVSYVAYVGQFFWPTGLAVFYPHPGNNLPLGTVAGAALVLACVSLAALVWLRRFPYLFVGWFWYLGTLVPMIGLVQIGSHAKADRYTYVTQIGLGIALAWGAAGLCRFWPRFRWVCRVGSALVLGGFAGVRLEADDLLARQRGPVDARPGMHGAQ